MEINQKREFRRVISWCQLSWKNYLYILLIIFACFLSITQVMEKKKKQKTMNVWNGCSKVITKCLKPPLCKYVKLCLNISPRPEKKSCLNHNLLAPVSGQSGLLQIHPEGVGLAVLSICYVLPLYIKAWFPGIKWCLLSFQTETCYLSIITDAK